MCVYVCVCVTAGRLVLLPIYLFAVWVEQVGMFLETLRRNLGTDLFGETANSN